MSTAMNFGTKSFQPRPPEKGRFPLDHFGECKSFKEKFMKNESKEYLECRMERKLMLQEPLEKLGFGDLIGGKSEQEGERGRTRLAESSGLHLSPMLDTSFPRTLDSKFF
uniref:CHCH domain-containing protein n=1 Tax=Aotus nancymaae TaxID=37293 RepID=A0A2K5BYR1_AOTNA